MRSAFGCQRLWISLDLWPGQLVSQIVPEQVTEPHVACQQHVAFLHGNLLLLLYKCVNG